MPNQDAQKKPDTQKKQDAEQAQVTRLKAWPKPIDKTHRKGK